MASLLSHELDNTDKIALFTAEAQNMGPALLRAASERARGTLRELDVSGWYRMPARVGEEALNDAQLLPVFCSI